MATGYWTTRCNWAGTNCPVHGRVVKAATAREAIGKVVDLSSFGPVHRERVGSRCWVALIRQDLPRQHGWGNPDISHGAIGAVRGRSK